MLFVKNEYYIIFNEFVNNICIHCGNDYYTPNSYFELTDDVLKQAVDEMFLL